MLIKLLVDDVDGYQKVITIDVTGSYFDQSRVLWDERIDGPIHGNAENAGKIGGWTRAGNALVQDPVKKAAYDALVASGQAAKQAKRDAKIARKALFQNVDNISNLADARACLKAIIQHLGADQ